ncbi:MAG: hypothetical protein HYY06_15155 [Deltaproteobacteria bacterium]|nr:hypothetical protein [Deltaproteobacteria bacterium]
MRTVPPALPIVLLVLVCLGCGMDERLGSGPALRIRTAGAMGPTAGLPGDVDRVVVQILDQSTDEPPGRVELTREELTDDTAWGVIGVPTGRPIELRVLGLATEEVLYTGVVGPFTLAAGERRYVDLLLVPAGAVTAVGRLPSARAMHTATTLADGRILIAGGVESAQPIACDGQPDGSVCYSLVASSRAWLYDPATGLVLETRGSMWAARAGHSATLLPDGRVLMAGGFSSGELVLLAVEGGVVPRLEATAEAALASTEVFDPAENPEEEDLEADGDPGRGGFSAGGQDLAFGRFHHTATLVPGTSAVLLAGGRGAGSSDTVEVWNAGITSGQQALSIPRIAHAAAPSADGVWLIGGAAGAVRNSQVVEIYSASGEDGLGTIGPVPREVLTEFPDDATLPAANAGLNLVGAGAVSLADRRYALVIGWLGPLCEGDQPAWAGEVCGPANRSFAIDMETGRVTQPVGAGSANHAFASVVQAPDGGVFVAGGLEDLSRATTPSVQRFTGTVDDSGMPAVDDGFALGLGEGRMMLAAAAQTDGTLVVTGGLSFEGETAVLSDLVEVVNPPRFDEE